MVSNSGTTRTVETNLPSSSMSIRPASLRRIIGSNMSLTDVHMEMM